MIYLFVGDDAKKKHATYEKFIKTIPKSVETFFIGKNDFDPAQAESFYSGSGLFFKKCAVFFEGIFELESAQEFILKNLPAIAESQNDFIFLESKLSKLALDAFKKARTELNIFELPKEKKEKYNNFILANDLGERNRFKLWLHFREAMDLGVGMEELVGVLFWKAKDMLLKKNYGKFTEAELKNFAGRLSYLLPEARKEGVDAESAFEQFLLEAL